MKCSEIILIMRKLLSELRVKLYLEQKKFLHLANVNDLLIRFSCYRDLHHRCTGCIKNQPWLNRSMSQMFPSCKKSTKIGTWKNIHRMAKRFYTLKQKITEYQIAVKIESIKVVCIFFSFIQSFHKKFIHNFYADYDFRRRVKMYFYAIHVVHINRFSKRKPMCDRDVCKEIVSLKVIQLSLYELSP